MLCMMTLLMFLLKILIIEVRCVFEIDVFVEPLVCCFLYFFRGSLIALMFHRCWLNFAETLLSVMLYNLSKRVLMRGMCNETELPVAASPFPCIGRLRDYRPCINPGGAMLGLKFYMN